MKNQYKTLKVKVVHFELNDAIRVSGPTGGGDENELPVVPFPTFAGNDLNP